MIKSPGITLYNQDRFSDEEFVANFVARNDLVEVLLASLRAMAEGGANEHQMLVGARGMGKTSLLRRIAIGVGQDAGLKAHFIPLRFREEQYNILSLDAFWRNCGESLAEYCEQAGNQALADRLDIAIETPEWRDHEKARDAFLAACAEAGGRAILLLDNLDLILDGIKEEGCWQLRAALQAAGGPIVIGAATQLLAQAADRDAAFYEFFHPHMLEPLSERELLACLHALADLRGEAGRPVKTVLAREPSRIKALFVLTGGNPRILGLIYRLFEQTGSDEIFADLEALLDQVTPFYKARIEEYGSALQRAVIDGIALNWDPITSSALAKETGIEPTTLSGQLNRLRKDGLIEEVETSGTRAGYQLAERFLNIWYLMRHGTRKTKQRLRWFTAFLSELFSADELQQMLSDSRSGRSARWHPDHCEAIEAAVELLLHRESVIGAISPSGDEADIALQTAFNLYNAGQLQEALQIWDRIIEEGRWWATDYERQIVARALVNKGVMHGDLGESAEAIAVYDDVIARFGESDLPPIQEEVARALVSKGVTLGELGQYVEAISVYDDVIARFGDSDLLALEEQVAWALVGKGWTLCQLGQSVEAIAVYNDVIARFGDSDLPGLQPQVAKAFVNKGLALVQLEHRVAAIAVYDDVISGFGGSDLPALQEQAALAQVNKSWTLFQLEKRAAAIAVCDDVIARFSDNNLPALQEKVAGALMIKGAALGDLDQNAEAITVYDEVIARFNGCELPLLQQAVASALMNKGERLVQSGQSEAAITVYDEVIARFNGSELPTLQALVARALVLKGVTLGQLGQSVAEMAVYDVVIARFGGSDLPELQQLVARALVNKGCTLGELGQSAEEIDVYDDVIARFGDSDLPALQEQVAHAMFNKGVTLDRLGQSAEEIDVYDDVIARFGDSDLPALQEQVARGLFNKGVTLDRLGQSVKAIAVYDYVITRFGGSDLPELQEQVAKARIRKSCLLFWELGSRTAGLSLLREVLEFAPDEVVGNAILLWMHLGLGDGAQAQALLPRLDAVEANGRAMMLAGIALVAENIGTSVGHLAEALEQGLAGKLDYTEDLLWYLRIAAERGHGERLITWFNETGNADRYAPIYGAFVAHVRGERFLLDLNPEVRGVALPFYRKLSPGRGDPGLRWEDAGGQSPRKRGRSKR